VTEIGVSTPRDPARWAELVSTALVGTDRRALAGGVSSSPDLLSQAAYAVVATRVGTPPGRYEGALPEPMPADPRPLLPAAAAVRLRSILDSYPKYLPEWLAAALAAGYRLPPAYFPELLAAARTNTLIRPDLAAVLGAPGRWLAATANAYRYILREPRETLAPEDWEGPDPDARLAYAAGLFRQDPEAGWRLVREAWPRERVPVKLGLLTLLDHHPETADLSFLDGLAADASKQVRDEATLVAGSVRRRLEKTPPRGFTAEATRIIAEHGFGRDMHNFVMSRTDTPWPEDGSRLLLLSLAAHAARGDRSVAWSGWLVEQILTAIGDHAPVSLCPDAARLVQEQALGFAAEPLRADVTRIDFTAVHAQLEYRRQMLLELAPQTTHSPER
jgi:uncharacterized protein DUF5691